MKRFLCLGFLVICQIVSSLQKEILLLAQGRSGSSFVSSWFDHIEDSSLLQPLVFIEPCSLSYTSGTVDSVGTDCVKILREIFTCNFSSVKPRLAHGVEIGNTGFMGWGNKTSLSNCKNRVKVIKETRLGRSVFATTEGRSLMTSVQSVILLRDPASIMLSRARHWLSRRCSSGEDDSELPTTYNETNIVYSNPQPYDPKLRFGYPYSQSIRSLCQEQTQWLLHGPFYKRSLIIHYENIVKNPLETAKAVFAHLGLHFPTSVISHIIHSTTGNCEKLAAPYSVCRNISGSITAYSAPAMESLVSFDAERDAVTRALLYEVNVECGVGMAVTF